MAIAAVFPVRRWNRLPGACFERRGRAPIGACRLLGGYTEATALARDAAGIDAGQTVRLVVYPRPEDPVDFLWRLLEEGDLNDFVRASGEIYRMITYTKRWMELVAPRLGERGIRAEADALEAR